LLHVHTASQVQVLVQQIPVTIFFCSPGTSPDSPRRGTGASFVPASIQSVQHGLVGRQSLLSDHVSHQTHHVIVRQTCRSLSELLDLVQEILGRGIREEILRLPALLHRLQEREKRLGGPAFQRLEELQSLWRYGVHYLGVLLHWSAYALSPAIKLNVKVRILSRR
jgi:hypothetical protein